jgi:hypothetical protein
MTMTISRPAALVLAATALLAVCAAGYRFFEPAAAAAVAQAAAEPPAAGLAAALPAAAALGDAANPAIADLQQRVARLDAQTAELQRRLASLTASATAPQAALEPSPQAALEPSAQAGPKAARRDTPPPSREIQAADRALAESREATFRAETLDARWSTATIAKLQQALSTADAGAPAVRSVECRSRTCRVEIGAADPQQLDTFMPGFANRIAATLGSIAASPVDTADGTAAMLLFLSR